MNIKNLILTFLMGLLICFVLSLNSYAWIDDSQITIRSRTDVSNKRKALIHFIWGSEGFPKRKLPSQVAIDIESPVSNLSHLKRVDMIHIAMDANQEGLAYHFVPVEPKGKLVILHHGHACTLNDAPEPEDMGCGMQGTIDALLFEGYSVLGVFMPHMTPDDCTGGHNEMFNIETVGSPMKFFLEPVAVSLHYLKTKYRTDDFPKYKEYHMVGLSGGGWTTVVYAAIDPTIKSSLPVAGTIPLYLRYNGSNGDTEQNLDEFYEIAGYPDLYLLGSYGVGRKQVHILNRRDDCCFGEDQHDESASGMSYIEAMRSYEIQVRQALERVGPGTFRLEIDDAATGHMISCNALMNTILTELNNGRRSIGASTSADAFVRGMDGDLWHYGSSGWNDTGFAMAGVPAVLEGMANQFDVFLRDPGNLLKHAYWTGWNWEIDDMPGAFIITDPVATSWGPGRLDVVAFGKDYKLYHWWSSDGHTFNLEQVSDMTGFGIPALVTFGENQLDLFFMGWDRALYHAYSNGMAPWTIEKLGGEIVDSPSAVTTDGDTLRVYVRGRNGELQEVRQTSRGDWHWTSLSPVTGSTRILLSGSPSAILQGDAVKVYMRTSAGKLSSFRLLGDRWSFSKHGKTITGSPTAVPGGVFVRGKIADLWLLDRTHWIYYGGDFY